MAPRKTDSIKPFVYPKGTTKWQGIEAQPTAMHWVRDNYSKDSDEPADAMIKRAFPRLAGETLNEWNCRMSKDPVGILTVQQWDQFPMQFENVRYVSGCAIADVCDWPKASEFFRTIDEVMNRKVATMKSMGFPSQAVEREGRWGQAFMIKNAVHSLLRAVGVASQLNIFIPGYSYYQSNMVIPQPECQGWSGVYNAGDKPAWTLMVTSATHDLMMKLMPHQLDLEPLRSYMTADYQRRERWRHYQAMIYATMTPEGKLEVPGWIASDQFMQKAKLKKITSIYDQENVRWETVDVSGKDRNVSIKTKVSMESKSEAYLLSIDNLHPLKQLLTRLQGFKEELLPAPAPRTRK